MLVYIYIIIETLLYLDIWEHSPKVDTWYNNLFLIQYNTTCLGYTNLIHIKNILYTKTP